MRICSLVLMVFAGGFSGCAVDSDRQGAVNQGVSSQASSGPAVQRASDFEPEGQLRVDEEGFNENFSKSEFIAADFSNVIERVPDFVPGRTRFTAALPRTRYGEILMERLRQAGFTILLGPNSDLPRLSYDIDLPATDPQNLHTFYVSVGHVHLKRSYEIVGDRIAPASEMLVAGIDINDLRSVGTGPAPRPSARATANSTSLDSRRVGDAAVGNAGFEAEESDPSHTGLSELKVPYLNRLLAESSEWDPLQPNMYESRTSVYEPLFKDSTADYTEISSRILVFPNDSLIMGEANKRYLQELASAIRSDRDLVSIIGCSHGKTELDNGNQRLAQGRALRVREELLHAGVNGDAILHEACWANKHFDEVMPRRGVVIKHLRDSGGAS